MSRKWRNKRELDALQDSGNAPGYGPLDSQYDEPQYPGPRETEFRDAQNYELSTFAVGLIADLVDWEMGGEPGDTKAVYSLGVVDSKNVDAHDFTGETQLVRRMPETNWGPVGTDDYSAILSVLYGMQESSHYFPNEVSQVDVIRGV